MPSIAFDDVDLIYPVREFYSITLKEFIIRGLFNKNFQQRWKTIHALKDVSFEIKDGERVGIIGTNGAGKSTLLRTIGGIYPTAKGIRQVDGTICALFDIALGFEPQATGWDNIRYRAYLQGETPSSIKAKMQEIADFTELGEFLDLPLTCYSTGMQMRLAFAIATSVQPEILLIDEIFGTGDLGFQKKAEARMVDFMNKANIVVMVGHALGFLEKFCTRMLWLDKGRVRRDGDPNEIIEEYKASFTEEPCAAMVAA